MLGGDVRCLARNSAKCHCRSNIDDRATAKEPSSKPFGCDTVRLLSGHHRRNSFRDKVGSPSVDIEDSIEVLVGRLVEGHDSFDIDL
jgi:hypothetical protein